MKREVIIPFRVSAREKEEWEKKSAVVAHYFCGVCDTYFDESYVATTLEALTGEAPAHGYTTVNGYKESDGHANTCSCGAHDTVVSHTPNAGNNDKLVEEKDGLGAGAIVGIVIGSVLVVALGGFAIFWFVIKKKNFAELLAIFKKG